MPRKVKVARAKSSVKKRRVRVVQAQPSTEVAVVPANDPNSLQNGSWANAGDFIGRALGSTFGRTAGNLGGWLGRRLLHYPAKLFGSGAYTMTGRGAHRIAPQVPAFGNPGDDSVIITHREYLGDIITSSSANTFKIQSFPLNPAESQTFPWLSKIAQTSFQQYKFEGCVFDFRSFSADALNSTNTALGSVFSCINYDYNDQAPASRYEVENTDWAMSCKPSENMLIPVECATSRTGLNGGLLYVINGNKVPDNTDAKTYYLGNVYIGTTGFQGTSINIGSLYVTYKVRLYKPIMTPPLSDALVMFDNRTSADGTNRLGTARNTSTAVQTYACDSIGITYTSGNVITISKNRLIVGQKFMFVLNYYGNSTASVVGVGITCSSGLEGLAYNSAFTTTQATAPDPAATSAYLTNSWILRVLDNSVDQTITVSGGTIPSGATVDIQMLQICGLNPSTIGHI